MARSTSRRLAELSWGTRRAVAAVTCGLTLVALTGGCTSPSEPAAPPPASPAAAPLAGGSPSGPQELTPVLASVLDPPIPFKGSDGRTHLVYELELTNFTPSDLTIDRVDVLDVASGEHVQTYGARAVRDRMQTAGVRESSAGWAPRRWQPCSCTSRSHPGRRFPST